MSEVFARVSSKGDDKIVFIPRKEAHKFDLGDPVWISAITYSGTGKPLERRLGGSDEKTEG